jgi:hypothetical protein
MSVLSKSELLAKLTDSNRRAEKWFNAFPANDFFVRQGEVWSASDNVDHLIKATKPITKAMKLPKLALQGVLGKASNPSRSYDEICRVYRETIASGGKASGRYLPDQETPSEPEIKKRTLLDEWLKASQDLIAVAETWDESDLDEYQLPHPLIGNLTVREMLFFTIYHNLRHASQEGD